MDQESETPPDPCSCPRCQSLEARVAELERQLAESQAGLPPLAFKAMRLLDHGWGEGWSLRPSPARRHWMDQLPYSYKCLPMVVANQWGWQILCPTDVVVRWDGGVEASSLQVDVAETYLPAIKSWFGGGIVTFSPPWLFRTPPGWDLYLKGPGNRWKANCVPLEGIIETWWLNYTFTLNWKLVEPGVVTFSRGESLGQIVPVPHESFRESTALETLIMEDEPAAAEELIRWRRERQERIPTTDKHHHYYRRAEGIDDHIVRLAVPPVTRVAPPPAPAPESEGGSS